MVGDNDCIEENAIIPNADRIEVGSNVYIGPYAVFYCALADIKIGNYVIIGPSVTIMTGDHRTDVVGKYMMDVNDKAKLLQNDLPVVIEDDVWIGYTDTYIKNSHPIVVITKKG